MIGGAIVDIPQPIMDALNAGNVNPVILWGAVVICAFLAAVCWRLYKDNQALHERIFQISLEQARTNNKLADAIKRAVPGVADDR